MDQTQPLQKFKEQFKKSSFVFKNKAQELDMNCSLSVQEQLKDILRM